MKITITRTDYEDKKTVRKMDLATFIKNELVNNWVIHGELENIKEDIEVLREFIGNLVNKLTEKKIFDENDTIGLIQRLCNSYDEITELTEE